MNYLLIGPEDYLKHQFLEKLKKSVSGRSRGDLDFEVFRGGASEISDITNSVNTLPFSTKARIVLIEDVDKFSSGQKESILKLLKSPKTRTNIVISSASRELNKFLTEISRLAKAVRCYRLKDAEINAWIRKEFTFYKKRISPPLAGLIREHLGNDLFLLKNEIEKIATFAGDPGEITEDHIEAVCGKTAYRTAFELVDLVIKKDAGKALSFVARLLPREKPHQILNLIAWQFRNFLRIKTADKDISPLEVSRLLGMSAHFARKACEQSRDFTERDLENNLEIILEADLFIKSGKSEPRHALERALVKLCSAEHNYAELCRA